MNSPLSAELELSEIVAKRVVQNVCELPDYNSPDEQPDLVTCTVGELKDCVLRAFENLSDDLEPSATPSSNLELDAYDAGLLGDGGGGDVSWWQDYIRAELGRAHDFYQSQLDAVQARADCGPACYAMGCSQGPAVETMLSKTESIHADVADARLRLIPALENVCRAFANGTPMDYGMRIPADITRDGDIICNDAAKVLGRMCQFLECLPVETTPSRFELEERQLLIERLENTDPVDSPAYCQELMQEAANSLRRFAGRYPSHCTNCGQSLGQHTEPPDYQCPEKTAAPPRATCGMAWLANAVDAALHAEKANDPRCVAESPGSMSKRCDLWIGHEGPHIATEAGVTDKWRSEKTNEPCMHKWTVLGRIGDPYPDQLCEGGCDRPYAEVMREAFPRPASQVDSFTGERIPRDPPGSLCSHGLPQGVRCPKCAAAHWPY